MPAESVAAWVGRRGARLKPLKERGSAGGLLAALNPRELAPADGLLRKEGEGEPRSPTGEIPAQMLGCQGTGIVGLRRGLITRTG